MRKRKHLLVGMVVLVGVVALALATSVAARQTAAFKAAWIYVGPHNDGGWSQAHDAGRLYVQKKLGSKVQTTYKENVPNNQVPQGVASLTRQGYKIIFGTSFGFFETGVNGQLYARYPSTYFEQATGLQVKKNQAEYFGAAEDTIFLSGIAAGAATKNGTIGYIVPFGIPEVIRHANAFALGAQLTHPGAKIKLVWTKSWLSPDKEKKAAESLHKSGGADVIGQNVDSPAAGQYAESAGIPWVGYDSNAKKFAKNSWLTAAVYNWGPYYLRRTQAAMNGTWKTGSYYGSMKDGFTLLAPYGSGVSAATKKLIAQQRS